MTILGLHIDIKIRAVVDVQVEANIFGDTKYDALRTVELYKQIKPQHEQRIDYIYTTDMLKSSISKFFSDLFQKIKGYLWK